MRPTATDDPVAWCVPVCLPSGRAVQSGRTDRDHVRDGFMETQSTCTDGYVELMMMIKINLLLFGLYIYTEWAIKYRPLRLCCLYCTCTCLAVQTIQHFNRRFFLPKMKPKPDKCFKILHRNTTI